MRGVGTLSPLLNETALRAVAVASDCLRRACNASLFEQVHLALQTGSAHMRRMILRGRSGGREYRNGRLPESGVTTLLHPPGWDKYIIWRPCAAMTIHRK